MLTSEDPKTVTLGIAIDYYPADKLELKSNGGNASFPFNFYRITLNNQEYTKLVDYFLSLATVPTYNFHIENLLHRQSSGEDKTWEKYQYGSGTYLVVQSGFVCLYPSEENKINNKWFPYSDEFTAPPPLFFECSYIAEPQENNIDIVSLFIKDFLTSNKIACKDPCEVVEKDEYGFGPEEWFTLPNYSAQLGYSETYNTFSEGLTKDLASELETVAANFNKAGWKTEINNTTNQKLIRNWSVPCKLGM